LIVGAIYLLLSLVSVYGPTDFSVAGMLWDAVISTLLTAFWATVQASLYIELRQWKEGDSAEALQKVFA
jgi:hypothetical protein